VSWRVAAWAGAAVTTMANAAPTANIRFSFELITFLSLGSKHHCDYYIQKYCATDPHCNQNTRLGRLLLKLSSVHLKHHVAFSAEPDVVSILVPIPLVPTAFPTRKDWFSHFSFLPEN
jgi:hypothetical protein